MKSVMVAMVTGLAFWMSSGVAVAQGTTCTCGGKTYQATCPAGQTAKGCDCGKLTVRCEKTGTRSTTAANDGKAKSDAKSAAAADSKSGSNAKSSVSSPTASSSSSSYRPSSPSSASSSTTRKTTTTTTRRRR